MVSQKQGKSVFQEQKWSTVLHDFITCFSPHSQHLLDPELMFFKFDDKLHEEEDHVCLVQCYILSAVNSIWHVESLINISE